MKAYGAIGMVLGFGTAFGNGGLGSPNYTEMDEVVETLPADRVRYISTYTVRDKFKAWYSGGNMKGFMQVILDRDQIIKFMIVTEDGLDIPIPADMASLEFKVKQDISDVSTKLSLTDSDGIELGESGNIEGDLEFPSSLRVSNDISAGDYYYEMVMISDTGEKTQLDFGTIKFVDSLR